MTINKVLNYIQYAIALGALISVFIWIDGGFAAARLFQRRITDWNFLWFPELFDTLFLVLIFLLSLLKVRIALLFTLLYFLKDLAINVEVLFGGILSPDVLTYLGEIIYILFLPLSVIGLVLLMIELFKNKK